MRAGALASEPRRAAALRAHGAALPELLVRAARQLLIPPRAPHTAPAAVHLAPAAHSHAYAHYERMSPVNATRPTDRYPCRLLYLYQ